MRLPISTTILVLSLALTGLHCGGSVDPVASAHGAEVAWFDGDPEAAFALAKKENRPLFLYWGAEWCPPCHALKARVFHAPEFVAKIQEFVPVYLDGDTERAQILGEELGAAGYPTVIIYTPSGQEVMRMPSDVSVERYVELLDRALSRMRPVSEVLAQVMDGGVKDADPADLELLAFYSWGQDHAVDFKDGERLSTFRELYRGTPADLPVERFRFLTLYLDEQVRHARRNDEGVSGGGASIGDGERARLNNETIELLRDSELRNANLPFVLHSCGETIDLLHGDDSESRRRLVDAWDQAAQKIEADESLSVDDRLTAVLPRIELVKLADGDPELPAELIEHLRDRVAWAGETVTDEGEMQAVMSSMVTLLDEAGLGDEAEALLEARMGDTHAPYYYMGWMASMKSGADDPTEALEWYRKAYDSARGRYSRFRWGSIYLRKVMDLTPDDVETIRADSIEILDELLTFEDAFAGGNYMRLKQLDEAYGAWNAEGSHDEVISQFRDRVHEACRRFPGRDEDSQRKRCGQFLVMGEGVDVGP